MTVPTAAVQLSADDARRLALRAQQLLGAPDRRGGVGGLVRSLGAVQLDTISVLARSHELVAYARLGPVGRPKVEAAYWSGDAFEYWAHAASILPLGEWPLFAFRRRDFAIRYAAHGERLAVVCADILARIRAEGPMTVTTLGGARRSAYWWDWSDVKTAAEFLIYVGRLICTKRIGWRRVYDLPERVLPPALLHDELDDDHCQLALMRKAAAALGVATVSDLADYFRLKKLAVTRLMPQSGLTPVSVQGWSEPAWADPAALSAGSAGDAKRAYGRHRTTLLSPFDSLVWDRKRTARMFGLDHRLEAYVPKELRENGYFAMPVLAGGRLIGRVDPARENGTLIARQVVLEPKSATPARLPATAAAVATALREAASWVGCDAVVIERAAPAATARVLRAALR
jgi:uncharacterized protein YcaQ